MRMEMMNVDPAALAGQMTALAGLLVHATAAAVAGQAFLPAGGQLWRGQLPASQAPLPEAWGGLQMLPHFLPV